MKKILTKLIAEITEIENHNAFLEKQMMKKDEAYAKLVDRVTAAEERERIAKGRVLEIEEESERMGRELKTLDAEIRDKENMLRYLACAIAEKQRILETIREDKKEVGQFLSLTPERRKELLARFHESK